jgi:RNA polymerase sigma-70 factor, ECF subfamily
MSNEGPRPIPGTPTSLTLLDRIRTSDQDAWRNVIYLYTPLVVYWCRRRGVREGDAEDVAQEVFRAVASGISTFHRDRTGDTFRGWLRSVTQHKALDWHRYRGRNPAEAAGGTEAGQVLNEIAADADDEDPSQLSELYHRALELVRGEFERQTWQAFWRVAVEGHVPKDVARDMGVSTAAVRKAKSRVMGRLREQLGDLIA